MDGLDRIPTVGIFCLFLRLTEQVTPFFWVNANDPRVPFAGMIEYTNLNPLPELGGDHILYVPQYLSADDPRYTQTDEEVLRAYTNALALVHPASRPPGSSSRRVPRSLRAANLPHRLPHEHAHHRDPCGEPLSRTPRSCTRRPQHQRFFGLGRKRRASPWPLPREDGMTHAALTAWTAG